MKDRWETENLPWLIVGRNLFIYKKRDQQNVRNFCGAVFE